MERKHVRDNKDSQELWSTDLQTHPGSSGKVYQMLTDIRSQELILRRAGRYSCKFSQHFKAIVTVSNIMELFACLFHLLSFAKAFIFPKFRKLKLLILKLGQSPNPENLFFIWLVLYKSFCLYFIYV